MDREGKRGQGRQEKVGEGKRGQGRQERVGEGKRGQGRQGKVREDREPKRDSKGTQGEHSESIGLDWEERELAILGFTKRGQGSYEELGGSKGKQGKL